MKHLKLYEDFGKALMSAEDAANEYKKLYGDEGDVHTNLAKFIGDNRDKLFGDPDFSIMDWYNMKFTDELMDLLGADKDYVGAEYEKDEYEGDMPKAADMRKLIGD